MSAIGRVFLVGAGPGDPGLSELLDLHVHVLGDERVRGGAEELRRHEEAEREDEDHRDPRHDPGEGEGDVDAEEGDRRVRAEALGSEQQAAIDPAHRPVHRHHGERQEDVRDTDRHADDVLVEREPTDPDEIEQVVKECGVVALKDQPALMQAINLARGIKMLRNILNEDFVKATFSPLAGTALGFITA